ncbi:simple sugar transport system permease protein [Nocardioides thalensis]|uniref:Simple sugar transport system permease protein n=1 Tax=Nocardioides thalensis TaxID=1914755 RepID=A0A853C5K7_9ACTN|nr:ABC transporter permease [Nocardioides thalensis]NYJ02549.1 simple sugar transport system permease protein [Nocardioides thalensis]
MTEPAREMSPQPETLMPEATGKDRDWAKWLPTVRDTVIAVALALLVGAFLIILSDEQVIESLDGLFGNPGSFFVYAGDVLRYSAEAVWDAYTALLRGAFGSGPAWERTLERSAPLICAGLGVALAFRAGLFNIGAQGQMLVAALAAGYVGFHYDMPPVIHLLAAIAAALVAGALWGGVVGLLKARSGAHEVITTIMLNQVGRFTVLFFLAREAFQRPGSDNLLSPVVDSDAQYPTVAGLHLGILVALLAAVAVWWLLVRSKLGFELRAVGANPDAARTAGMSVSKVYIAAMAIAGLLAGLAATMTVLGLRQGVTDQVVGSVGFDAITVALLGRATPFGTVLAGLLFGALSAGGLGMQTAAGVPPELIQVVQALIVLFVAAPALIRGLTRIRRRRAGTEAQEVTA